MRPIPLLVAASALFTTACDALAAERPNVILVLVDDMGWGDLSCFGNKDASTPNIDRLASEGIRFTQFYTTSPICSPSRAALATGQYPHRWRITSYLSDRRENERRGVAQWLDPGAPTIARQLKAAGYATGHFGKWHLGGQRDVGEAPPITDYGFDASLTNFEGLGPRVLPLGDTGDGNPPKKHALGSDNLGRGPIRWEDRSKVTAAYVAEAVGFIDAAQRDGRPFYVNLWPDDVHSPFFPPVALRGDGAKRTLYHAVLETMDAQLGVLFDRVRGDETLRESTLILLMSDNGPEPGAGSAGPFRGAKAQLYEGGIRSPLIAWGPGLIAPDRQGTTEGDAVFSSLDLAASVLALTETEVPGGVTLDGEEVSATVTGRSSEGRKAPLFWRRPPDRPGPPRRPLPDLAVREGDWKLLCSYDGSEPQLYDLWTDAGETTDLAGDRPEVVSRLREAVLAWNAGMPQDAGPGIGPGGDDR